MRQAIGQHVLTPDRLSHSLSQPGCHSANETLGTGVVVTLPSPLHLVAPTPLSSAPALVPGVVVATPPALDFGDRAGWDVEDWAAYSNQRAAFLETTEGLSKAAAEAQA